MRFPSVVLCFTAAPLAVLASSTALAPVQSAEADGFLTGFLHPISGLDHVLAISHR
jgi:hydrogenase/urease accessory protein HupE